MFDVGFSEMVLVSLVALLAFGPERLPRLAREAALWLRKARSFAASVRREINSELQLEDFSAGAKRWVEVIEPPKELQEAEAAVQPRGTPTAGRDAQMRD